MNFTDSQLRLYLVTERGMLRGRDLTDVVMQAVEGGVTMVQLRERISLHANLSNWPRP